MGFPPSHLADPYSQEEPSDIMKHLQFMKLFELTSGNVIRDDLSSGLSPLYHIDPFLVTLSCFTIGSG